MKKEEKNKFLVNRKKRKKPYAYKENQHKGNKEIEVKPFYDLAGGPNMAKIKLSVLDKDGNEQKTKLRENFYLWKVYSLGHYSIMSDPYIGSISFRPGRTLPRNYNKYSEKFKDLEKNGEKNNKYGITYTWFEGSFPWNLFKVKKIYSQNFEVRYSKWSGTKTIILKDWRKKTSWFTYAVYATVGFLALTSGVIAAILV